MHRYGRVAYHIEAAAASGSFGSEARNDHVSTWLNCMQCLLDVLLAVVLICQEMKHCAVMPHHVSRARQVGVQDIRCKPVDKVCAIAEPALRDRQRCRSNVEHSHIAIASVEQPVDQSRSATADVDYRSIQPRLGSLDQLEGKMCFGLVPAYCGRRVRAVDLFPVSLVSHATRACDVRFEGYTEYIRRVPSHDQSSVC